jgi:acetyl esterase/lipase
MLRLLSRLSVVLLIAGAAAAAPAPLRDIPYVTGGHERQKLDLLLPAEPRHAPVILWIHGGGWVAGAKEQNPLRRLTDQGYVVAAMNYRYSTHAPFPAQLQDAKSAVRWLRLNSGRYGFDGDRIAAWGASAGGMMVELMGTTAGRADFVTPDNPGASSDVQAVVSFCGPTDFPALISSAVAAKQDRNQANPIALVALLLGGPVAEREKEAAAASALSYAAASASPMLIIHGEKDSLVPVDQSRRFEAALTKAGARASLLVLPDAGHNDVLRAETVLAGLRFTDQALGVRR